jgi:nitrate reductase NapAB chaperone NapD
MEQKMERLVAAIEKMDAKKMETNQEKMMVKLDAHQERMMTTMDSQLEKMEAVVYVFKDRLNKMDTMDLEAS